MGRICISEIFSKYFMADYFTSKIWQREITELPDKINSVSHHFIRKTYRMDRIQQSAAHAYTHAGIYQ
jgi:hypothetical protein